MQQFPSSSRTASAIEMSSPQLLVIFGTLTVLIAGICGGLKNWGGGPKYEGLGILVSMLAPL